MQSPHMLRHYTTKTAAAAAAAVAATAGLLPFNALNLCTLNTPFSFSSSSHSTIHLAAMKPTAAAASQQPSSLVFQSHTLSLLRRPTQMLLRRR